MKAFISYSHQDTSMLDVLHKHLAQLQREGWIQTWEDRKIQAGGSLDQQISNALEDSQLFLALLSPDYISSAYCYEKEFQRAMQLQEEGRLTIVPIILEPCDWLSTPFRKFKALPKDGKPISIWENRNTAFLDVTQNLRKLVQAGEERPAKKNTGVSDLTRNYRVQKDFDSIEKLEFLEKSYHDVKERMKRYIDEILQLENIKVRVLQDDDTTFKAMLVNRNKIATEAELTITTRSDGRRMMGYHQPGEKQIYYSIGQAAHPVQKSYSLAFDEYQLYWTENNPFFGRGVENTKLTPKEMAEAIWNDWLSNVGIL